MYLYRYRDLSHYTEAILRNNELYYNSPTAFNDPFDGDLPLDCRATKQEYSAIVSSAAIAAGLDPIKAVRRALRGWPVKDATVQASVAATANAIIQNSSICCFSTIGHHVLLFSHYGNSHKGICLQFSPGARARLGVPLKVSYRMDYPELRFAKLRNHPGELTKSLLLTKHIDWKYEDERRVVRLNTPAGVVPFDPSDLTGIIFGCKTSMADVNSVKGWLKHGGAQPILYRAFVSRSKFELNLRRI